MRRLFYFLLFFLLSAVAQAQTYSRMDFFLQTAMGQAVAGATVTVENQSACGTPTDGTLALIYSTATGGVIVGSQVTTDGFGHAYAYVSPGCYTVVYSSPLTGTVTYADQSPAGGASSANISGQASGVIPLATGTTIIGAQSHLDDGVTTPGKITASEAIAVPNSSLQQNVTVGWGDSLTLGNEGQLLQGAWPDLLQNSIGSTVINNGIGGQTSSQIGVREGGVSTTMTISGGVIPACAAIPCTGVTVTFTTGFEPVTSQGPWNGVMGTCSGTHGVVTLASGTYTFRPDNIGASNTVASCSYVVDRPYANAFPVMWVGRNNIGAQSQIISDLTGMIATVPAGQGYLCLSIPNRTDSSEWSGATNYNTIIADNAAIQSLCGANYLDIRSTLVAAYNPASPVDVSDHGHDVPPTSLRAVIVTGTITQDISPSDTSFTITGTGFTTGVNIVVDQEEMAVTNQVGSTITVVRCQGGTCGSHTNGTPYTEYDNLHFSVYGAQIEAAAISAARASVAPWYKNALSQPNLSAFVPNYLTYSRGSNLSLGPYSMSAAAPGVANTAFGVLSGQRMTSGQRNTFTGWSSGQNVTTGINNNAFGYGALGLDTTGFENDALGSRACFNVTTGAFNVCMGFEAGFTMSNAQNGTFLGFQAGHAINTSNPTFIGYQSFTAATGSGNTGVGAQTGLLVTTGTSNTMLGQWAGNNTSTGLNGTTLVGFSAGQNTQADGTTAVGQQSLQNNTTGAGNTAVGQFAVQSNLTGQSITGMGLNACQACTASGNTAIGANALKSIAAAANNTAVGANAGVNGSTMATTANGVYIGSGANDNADGYVGNIIIGFGAQGTASHQFRVGTGSLTSCIIGNTTIPCSGTSQTVITTLNSPADVDVAVTGATYGAGTCTSGTTFTMTGLTTSMAVIPGFTADPSAIVGWGTAGGLTIAVWASSSNTGTYKICNPTGSSITGGSITFRMVAR